MENRRIPGRGPQVSAGTLLYRCRSNVGGREDRRSGEVLEVLLVHPSGAYNRRSPWSIPKGLPEPGESLEQAARRETEEEAGVRAGTLVDLGEVAYTRSRKIVHCFAGEVADAAPRPASWEVDKAEFMTLDEARRLLHEDQRAFLDRLGDHLSK